MLGLQTEPVVGQVPRTRCHGASLRPPTVLALLRSAALTPTRKRTSGAVKSLDR